MARSLLHEFDLDLCDYARGTIRACLPKPIPELGNVPEIRPGKSRDPYAVYETLPLPIAAAAWLRWELSPSLIRFLLAPEPPRFLLTERQIDDLAEALASMRRGLISNKWIPWESLHQQYVGCLPEIRHTLASAVAERFARRSARYGKQLEKRRLLVWDGLKFIAQWVEDIRDLLRAMGRNELLPRPAGRQPTPDHPDEQLGDDIVALVERIRRKFEADPSLRSASRNAIHAAIRGNKQKTLKALDWLAERGEYSPKNPVRRAN